MSTEENLQTKEFPTKVAGSGGLMLLIIPALLIVSVIATLAIPAIAIKFITGFIAFILLVSLMGFYINNPNEASVIVFFGKYKGTDRVGGLRWVPPFHDHKKISLKISNFESETLKINDKMGNPIEFSAIVSYCVDSTSQALFDVDNYQEFTEIQSEAGLRDTVTLYPYDHGGEENDSDEITLRGNSSVVTEKLQKEVQSRVSKAGMKVLEVRINHLAYATEIAQAMLQRQQATALIAARATVVDGSIGIIEKALQSIAEKNLGKLEDKDKNAIISNMLLVLAGDANAQPVINTQQSSS